MDDYEKLTNDAKYLLSSMYKLYLERIDNGDSKKSANHFGSSYDIKNALLPNEDVDNVDIYAKELSDKGFLITTYGSNIIWTSKLSTEAIAFMQHKFGNNIKSIAKGIFEISKLIL